MSSWMLMCVFVKSEGEEGNLKKKNTEVIQIPHYQNKKSLKIIPSEAMIQMVKKYQVLIQ